MMLLSGILCAESKRCATCERTAAGKIKRSAAARREFIRHHPCPATGSSSPNRACPGWIIDHKIALYRGGADRPENMQWETKAEARAKDRSE
jgi:hypothetical protein